MNTTISPNWNLFDSFRAEGETEIAKFFVAPQEYELLKGNHSAIIFGRSGTGKTILYRRLQQEKPKHMIVEWRPAPLSPGSAEGTHAARQLASHMVDACAIQTAAFLGQNPQTFNDLPQWTQDQLVWFIQRGVQGSLSARIGPLIDESTQDGAELLTNLVENTVEDVFYNPAPDQLISSWLSTLKRLGFQGTWILTDGLEGWAISEPDRLTEDLKAFYSSLVLFEKDLVFKIFLPARLEPAIIRARGVESRRLRSYRLNWDTSSLRELVEKRLALYLGQKAYRLEDLCRSEKLIDWLERVGGGTENTADGLEPSGSPRDWLDQVGLLARYLVKNNIQDKTIDEKTWLKLRRQSPPRFWMDEEVRSVRVGGREIPLDDLPPKAYDMLKYLYQHSSSVVSKADLYFLVYLGMNIVPRSGDEDYEYPSEYAGLIDTNLYRIRKAIEPDPKNPTLLQTVRGHGVKLVSRW